MKRIIFPALTMILAAMTYSSAFGGQQQTPVHPGPELALELPAPDRPAPSRVAPFPAQPERPRGIAYRPQRFTYKSKRFYRCRVRECPGYTMSRRARLRVNRTVERLLALGFTDPLSQPAYLRAVRAEKAVLPAVDRCNKAWLRHVSIYTGRRHH
jgi:hypothetical protein